MGIGRTANEVLRLAGWTAVNEIPAEAMDKLEANSQAAIKLFDGAVTEIYESFHHAESDRYILITNGGGSFTVNAEGLLLATANPDRLDTETNKDKTMIFTIGLDDKTVANWLMWVAAQRNLPERRPDRGFNYIS